MAETLTPSAGAAEVDGPDTKEIEDQPFLRFPPFPPAPPGVTIMPFSVFVPKGIVITDAIEGASDAVEVDGLGIPTVPLRTKHAVDGASKKKKKKKKGYAIVGDPTRPIPWWEAWAEGESQRGLASRLDP